MKLKKRVKVLNIRIAVNANKKDYEVLEEIAKALNIEVGSSDNEFVELKSGFTGDVERLKRGLV